LAVVVAGVVASTMSVMVPRAAAQPAEARVTGAEIEGWLAADQMAVAGLNVINGCHFINKGPGSARVQTVYCANTAPFTVTGEARVEGDRLCSRFVYPDGSRTDSCQDIFRVGENKYETRLNGATRTVFYRLIR
jgi:hypothetical protein